MELSIDQALQKGVTAHKEGKLQEAESIYRAILQSQPSHPDANHNLGVLAVSINKVDASLPLFKAALEANPKIEQFWLSYIDALIKEKQFDNARQVLNQAQQRGLAEDKFNILKSRLVSETESQNESSEIPSQEQLNRLLKYYEAGYLIDAEKLALSITQDFPKHPFAWKVLGVVLGKTGRQSEAVDANQTAVVLLPQDAAAYSNLGDKYRGLGRLDEAKASCKRALILEPDFAEGHNNMGITLQEMERLGEAQASFTKAILFKPHYAEAHNNFGVALQRLGRLDEAEASHKQAIRLKPDFAEAHNNLGSTLKKLGRLDEAEVSFAKAIKYKDDYAEANYNLGNTLQRLGRLDEAEASHKQAIRLKPDLAEAYNNLGNTLQKLGRLEEVEASLKQAIALKPDYTEAFWNLHSTQKTIQGAEHWIDRCLKIDESYQLARLTRAALRFYQGDKNDFDSLMQSKLNEHAFMRSFSWVFSLPNRPELHFNKWCFFDAIIKKSTTSKPFYEFGVWRAASFKYLIKSFKKGFGFDTFTGLPEDWNVGSHVEKKGSYTSDGNVPKIKGGEFVVGRFEDTLPVFFSEPRPIASLINFDADLYSSTICALNFSKLVIDEETILIFDEFILHESWEQDEFKALNEFCSNNQCSYEVIAVSFFTKQVAVKLIGI